MPAVSITFAHFGRFSGFHVAEYASACRPDDVDALRPKAARTSSVWITAGGLRKLVDDSLGPLQRALTRRPYRTLPKLVMVARSGAALSA